MRLKVLFVFFALCGLINLSLLAKSKAPLWSSFQGKMSWEYAKERCESMEMRIPTKQELWNAYKNKTTKYWVKDSAIFFSEEDFSVDLAFDQFVSYNQIYWTSEETSYNEAIGFDTFKGVFRKTNKLVSVSLRCIKDNSKKEK